MKTDRILRRALNIACAALVIIIAMQASILWAFTAGRQDAFNRIEELGDVEVYYEGRACVEIFRLTRDHETGAFCGFHKETGPDLARALGKFEK